MHRRRYLPLAYIIPLVFLSGAPVVPTPAGAQDLSELSRAVVKLFVTTQGWDMRRPWTKQPVRKAMCSGFFIEQGILTNAHCVGEATFIEIEVQGVPNKLIGKVVAVGHASDLALVDLARPEDRSRLPRIPRIRFGELPEYREKVVTVGYPTGGRQISFTEGVVSRIDVMRSAHSQLPILLVQTDAAINPGNSGGPVFSDRSGRCLGVATQKYQGGEGLGYFVPTPMIRQFLTDLADGHVDGITNLGITFQPLENDALRRWIRLDRDVTGIRVSKIAKGATADGVLQPDDVLVEIEGQRIFNDGRVPFRHDHRIGLNYTILPRQVGERIRLVVYRQGERLELEARLRPYRFAVVPEMPAYGEPPDFRLLAGLVFLRVEPRYLWLWGGSWSPRVPIGIRTYQRTPVGEEGLEELVVISSVYDAPANKGYGGWVENRRIMRVNGRAITRLADLDAAFAAAATAPYFRVELEDGTQVVLDRDEALRADPEIRARYGIPADAGRIPGLVP